MWVFSFCNDVVRFKDWLLRRKRFVPKKSASSKGEHAIVATLEKLDFGVIPYLII